MESYLFAAIMWLPHREGSAQCGGDRFPDGFVYLRRLDHAHECNTLRGRESDITAPYSGGGPGLSALRLVGCVPIWSANCAPVKLPVALSSISGSIVAFHFSHFVTSRS